MRRATGSKTITPKLTDLLVFVQTTNIRSPYCYVLVMFSTPRLITISKSDQGQPSNSISINAIFSLRGLYYEEFGDSRITFLLSQKTISLNRHSGLYRRCTPATKLNQQYPTKLYSNVVFLFRIQLFLLIAPQYNCGPREKFLRCVKLWLARSYIAARKRKVSKLINCTKWPDTSDWCGKA